MVLFSNLCIILKRNQLKWNKIKIKIIFLYTFLYSFVSLSNITLKPKILAPGEGCIVLLA